MNYLRKCGDRIKRRLKMRSVRLMRVLTKGDYTHLVTLRDLSH